MSFPQTLGSNGAEFTIDRSGEECSGDSGRGANRKTTASSRTDTYQALPVRRAKKHTRVLETTQKMRIVEVDEHGYRVIDDSPPAVGS
jgi:hypothetical protein